MVATILLSSYELLAFPGSNYRRHFKGAKSLVEALGAHQSSDRMTRVSFWIYVRHEVGEAMNIECKTMQDPKIWPKALLSETPIANEDIYCNDALRLCGEVVCFIFGSDVRRQGKKWAKEWSGLQQDLDDWLRESPKVLAGNEYMDNGSRRFWFPRFAFASALCYYHVSRVFLFLHQPRATLQTPDQPINADEKVQYHARELIDIALSGMPDSVLVTMVQPMYHAARWVNDPSRREEVIALLEQIQGKTGFHTESKVLILKSLRVLSS
ncbi:hypothetical protein H2198_002756 [Neophaeococcomyces mojaviensis]|uniref:Uncharacterized protein n=1 Tax=Neophaeococcomyces mojaviensis TaxID=3383035 RepID=A0ACC3ADM1_9EURO|nr:hypothetical protein H2198_002756 [Knufia sp. JES_112]